MKSTKGWLEFQSWPQRDKVRGVRRSCDW